MTLRQQTFVQRAFILSLVALLVAVGGYFAFRRTLIPQVIEAVNQLDTAGSQ